MSEIIHISRMACWLHCCSPGNVNGEIMSMRSIAAGILGLVLFQAAQAHAADVMPSFAGAPAGWTVDRFAPLSFSDVGTYQGKSDVLGIGIGTGATPGSFYNTQGESHPTSEGSGSSITANVWRLMSGAPGRRPPFCAPTQPRAGRSPCPSRRTPCSSAPSQPCAPPQHAGPA